MTWLRDNNTHLNLKKCIHGVILYGTHCLTCERKKLKEFEAKRRVNEVVKKLTF